MSLGGVSRLVCSVKRSAPARGSRQCILQLSFQFPLMKLPLFFKPAGILVSIALAVSCAAHAVDDDGKLRIIVFGAHPDDAQYKAGGTAAKWAKLGHSETRVRDQWRHRPLAIRRWAAGAAAARRGAESRRHHRRRHRSAGHPRWRVDATLEIGRRSSGSFASGRRISSSRIARGTTIPIIATSVCSSRMPRLWSLFRSSAPMCRR